MRRAIISLLALLLLTACGTASESPILGVARTALQSVRQAPDRPSLDAQRAAIIKAVRASGSSEPVLLVTLPQRKAIAALDVAGVNDGAVTWLDNTGVSVVTRRGVVIATRGLGADVMASDVSGTLAALDHGGAGYVRLQRFLDGEGQLRDRRLTCDAVRHGTRLTETCRGNGGRVTNIFELRGGEVSASRQWLGSALGYAEIIRIQ